MLKPATALAAVCLDLLLIATLPAATVGELRCEYRSNPLGIDVVRPRLSWIIESTDRGERQTAYRVLVASSPERLAQDEGDLWDSGKVASDRSTQIDYEGRPLTSHQWCLWKVRVWDRRDQPQA
jgi:alpha-L-rhamnosidase